ncbi:type II toxin-antitoxin system RelE/ParE family toxin [Methylohalobius crimeensis]|uniref:type II toxin-antitoxin system RelE/ParE family toxin n=1 Tax=Methylohalobius crimeensis TaxID=244365 RepID=UPI0004259AC8|nr:type II toxin-antitoxin system RelE/ParE family toxin [Methylohalobius crimeensis]
MRIEQKPTFRRNYKKLHKNQRRAVQDAIRYIAANPETGVEKIGDLRGIKVFKFDCISQEYLLAYEYHDTHCVLLAVEPHENFYRDLKRR